VPVLLLIRFSSGSRAVVACILHIHINKFVLTTLELGIIGRRIRQDCQLSFSLLFIIQHLYPRSIHWNFWRCNGWSSYRWKLNAGNSLYFSDDQAMTASSEEGLITVMEAQMVAIFWTHVICIFWPFHNRLSCPVSMWNIFFFSWGSRA